MGQDNKTQLALKVPPNSVEAEQSVVGALMLDNRAWDRIADHIREVDFYRNDHRLIFAAMARLAERNQPFDVLTVAESLKQSNQLDKAGGEAYLYELAQNTPSAANVTAYADIVREKSVMRQLIAAGTDIIEKVYQPEGCESKELLDIAERSVFQISEQH